jgi:hypothetical protein
VDDVERRLTGAGATVRRTGPVLLVGGLTDDELLDLAARAVADSGARLRRLGRHRRTLDDIFAEPIPPAPGALGDVAPTEPPYRAAVDGGAGS